MAWMRNTRNAVAWDPGTLGAWDGDLPKYTYIRQQISSHVICGAVFSVRFTMYTFQDTCYGHFRSLHTVVRSSKGIMAV